MLNARLGKRNDVALGDYVAIFVVGGSILLFRVVHVPYPDPWLYDYAAVFMHSA